MIGRPPANGDEAAERFQHDLAAFSQFGASPGGINRPAWGPALRRALDWLGHRMREAGLAVRLDGAGNLIGEWRAGTGPAIVTGSHADTEVDAGRFDGAYGVIAGLEAFRRLQENGLAPRRPLWVVAFMDEEGERFGTAMFGSRALAGEDVSNLLGRADRDAVTLATAMQSWPLEETGLAGACQIDRVGAFVELHVEQGPVLEARQLQIGIVTAITGIEQWQVCLTGNANHAGTTPLMDRRDALVAAGRAIVGIREAAQAGGYLATTGRLDVVPNSPSAIAGGCSFTIDVRSDRSDALARASAELIGQVRKAAAQEKVDMSVRRSAVLPPIAMDSQLVRLIERVAQRRGWRHQLMISGAGHDSMVLARQRPTGMIFVPSHAGVSHSPAEYTSEDDCETGVQALTDVLAEMLTAPAPVPGPPRSAAS